jgi:signal transduction histidine kinase
VSYAIVTLAFTVVAGWGVVALRNAASEAVMMRSGYLPLALALRDAVASQDIWNTQLNHITTAKNPADKRVWFELALRGGRPKTFSELRAVLARAFEAGDATLQSVGQELSGDATEIERFLEGDREPLSRLFEALKRRDEKDAEALRERLVTRGHQGKKRLSELESRVQTIVDGLIAQARSRERLAIRLLAALGLFTVLVGVAMAFYARRVLAPLGAVTERANAVARGDLTPREVVASRDEIGELAATFEAMVAAISKANADLLASERLATIGKMAAHVTHEIRNPLSSLALNAELLEEELGTDNAEALALQRAIKSEIDRLTGLSERYLSVARRKPPRFEEEDLRELCRESLEFVRPEMVRHGITADLELAEDVPSLRVDEGQIRQALYNLLRNAREATPAGGRILVSVRPDGTVELFAQPGNVYVNGTRVTVEILAPDEAEESLAVEDQALVAHEGGQQVELLGAEGDRLAAD